VEVDSNCGFVSSDQLKSYTKIPLAVFLIQYLIYSQKVTGFGLNIHHQTEIQKEFNT
jgi:hypothetical protein